MIKSMTGFSKAEINESGVNVAVEIKSLNGRYLEMSCRMPKNLQHKENEIREIIRKSMNRGSVSVNIYVELDETQKQFTLNQTAALHVFNELNELRKTTKIKDAVRLEHLLHFSQNFIHSDNTEDEINQINIIKKAIVNALKSLDIMRKKEGQQIMKDINMRMKNITDIVDKVEKLGVQRVPQEREKLRQRLAQLFESDEYDEQRLQTEMVLMADRLDISEECVRLKSHFKFYYEAMKDEESVGRKINFLLQEMNREINTIGSKANDAQISQLVIGVKEELERIREQIQNIE